MSSQRKRSGLFLFFLLRFFAGAAALLRSWGREDVLRGLILNKPVIGPIIAGLVGLIPNCAASVAIAQLYVEGVLGFGPCMAGLLSATGIGLLVLLRTNRRPAQNVAIIGVLVIFSAFCGLVIQALT